MSKKTNKPHKNVREEIERLEQRTEEDTAGKGVIESARVGILAKAQREFSKTEIPLSATELARLAMISSGNTATPAEIENSTIDDIIELVARCQWRIELSRKSWGAYGAAFYYEALDRPETPENIQKICELRGPIDFDQGLLLLGVPGRGTKTKAVAEVRKEKFYPFFEQWVIDGSEISYKYPTGTAPRSTEPWVKPTNREIKAKYKETIEKGWPEPSGLILFAEQYAKWREWERSETNKKNATKKKPD